MKKFLIPSVFLLLTFHSQILNAQVVEPYGYALTVSDLETSTKWYCSVFDVQVFKEMNFPEYDSLQINFLKNSRLQFELIEKATSFKIKDYKTDYDPTKELLIGISKLVFKIEDLDSYYKKIKKSGVKILFHITEDSTFNLKYFIVEDPDGNWIQFLELNK